MKLDQRPSGHCVRDERFVAVAAERGGVTPFNLLPIPNGNKGNNCAGFYGHGAGTPLPLADWWTRYITPLGGVVLDPFSGSGTMGLAAIALDRSFIGIERDPGYFAIGQDRINSALAEMKQFLPLSHEVADTAGSKSRPA